MATGIVSVASHLVGMSRLSLALFWFNIPAFAILVVFNAIRLIKYRKQFFADLTDHKRGVGFFTAVAATCVLGSQCVLLVDLHSVAIALWCLGTVLWIVLTYTIFTSFAVKETKPSLAEGIHGGWLVSVVAVQSVSLLGGILAEGFESYREEVLFFSLAMWLKGGMLYIWIISLIFYRYTFFSMSPADLAPPYWINMGAMAISTLAGTTLISAASDSTILLPLLSFLKGFTLFFWATATWWIPMLVILGVWRHVYKRFRIIYDPQYWGAVFPLGMYTACTFRLAHAIDAPFLVIIPQYFIYIAISAWTLTFAGMMYSFVTVRAIGTGARQGANGDPSS
ncbi:MAG: C4-dicarboxylate ABC transporter [Planctomycetota bacterium]|nr:MAG: C4-dicarboxylate ABC transporter [Planctomycetota bacterium]